MSPEPSPAACGELQHPGVELRAIQGLGSPRSILALLFPALGMVGELPCPHPAVQTQGCSASHLTAADLSPALWVGFEAPLAFSASVTEVPWPRGDAGLQ